MPELSGQLLAILGLGAIVGVALLILTKFNFKWASLPMTAMIFFSAIATAVDFYDTPYQTWIKPLSDNRSFLYMVCGLGLAVIAGLSSDVVSIRHVTAVALFSFFLSIWGGLIQIFHDGLAEGMKSLAFAASTLLSLAIVVGGLVRRWGDWIIPMRCIGFATAIWAGAAFMQFVIDRRYVTLGNENRFIGVASNPQHTAAFLALAGVVVIYLSLAENYKLLKLMWIGLAAAVGVMLFWTGSRTGFGMITVGVALMLYSRLGKLIFVAPVIVVVIAFLLRLFAQDLADVNTDRLTSTDDSRTFVWIALLEGFMDNPVLGAGPGRVEASENGWLLGASNYGAGYLFIQMIITGAAAIQCWKLWRYRSILNGRDRSVTDAIIGVFLAFFAGSVFEGYFAARISVSIVIMVVVSVVGGRLIQLIKEHQAAAAEFEHERQAAADAYADYAGDSTSTARLT